MDIYHKSPSLKVGSIRLLKVETASDGHGKVRCSLDVAQLSTEPTYCALSYTWGSPWPADYSPARAPDSPAATHTQGAPAYNVNQEFQAVDSTVNGGGDTERCLIICNDVNVWVTRNLFNFLSHWSRKKSPGYIWIDALCINQRNINERSHQITMMAEIYRKASSVLVWLGVEDVHAAQGIEFLRKIACLTTAERLKLRPESIQDHENWISLSHLFQRSWFNRAWIIQEVFFARDVTVLCGSYVVSWADMTMISRYISSSTWAPYFKKWETTGVTNCISTEGYQLATRLRATKKSLTSYSGHNLLLALIRSRLSVCQDPRDKVYSQLQLGNADIFPTYNASISEVFTSTAVYILQYSDNLLLLCCVEGGEFQRTLDLPSWVPDWSVNKSLGLRIAGYPQFSVGLGRTRKLRIVREDGLHILSLEAAEFDEIMEIYGTKDEIRNDLVSSRNWRMFQNLDLITAENLWRTLITNRSSDPGHGKARFLYPASIDIQESFHDWILWRIGESLRHRDTKAKMEVLSSITTLSKAGSILPSDSEIQHFLKECIADCEYHNDLYSRASLFDLHYTHAMFLRPFKTRRGYFGLGTQCLRQGDSVFIASGCRVPLIFRPVSATSHFRLVGGSYVHGVMDAKALEGKDIYFKMISLI